MTIYTTIVPIRPDCTEAPAPGEVAQLQLTGAVLQVGGALSNAPLFGRYARIDALPA